MWKRIKILFCDNTLCKRHTIAIYTQSMISSFAKGKKHAKYSHYVNRSGKCCYAFQGLFSKTFIKSSQLRVASIIVCELNISWTSSMPADIGSSESSILGCWLNIPSLQNSLNSICFRESIQHEDELRDRERVSLAYCMECMPKDDILYRMQAKGLHSVQNAKFYCAEGSKTE